MGIRMNVYDFDGTIYKKDCSIELFKYSVMCMPWIALQYLPKQILAILKYKLSWITKEEMKEIYFSFLKSTDISGILKKFVDHELRYINRWYLNQKSPDDVIISASPEFLVRAVMEQMGITNVIASRVDIHTGKYEGKNCHGQEKLTRFLQEFPEAVIDNFYSDSETDIFLAKKAAHAFLIKKGKIIEWKV